MMCAISVKGGGDRRRKLTGGPHEVGEKEEGKKSRQRELSHFNAVVSNGIH